MERFIYSIGKTVPLHTHTHSQGNTKVIYNMLRRDGEKKILKVLNQWTGCVHVKGGQEKSVYTKGIRALSRLPRTRGSKSLLSTRVHFPSGNQPGPPQSNHY